MNIALLLTINAVFGCLVLVIGFAAGLWFSKTSRPSLKIASTTPATEIDLGTALQHAHMAYSSLLRMANGMSNNIAAHSTKVAAISDDIRAIDLSLPEAKHLMVAAPERLLAVNLELQQQLTAAKLEIESKSALLRTRESEARTDALTGLFNRRAFEEEIRKQFGVWQRKNIGFALLLLDIDRFKPINDTHGHQIGDEVLREVAERIVGLLRDMDSAFRYGGEEFAVLLPATDINAATTVGERIRQAIEAAVLACVNKQIKVTISIGATPIIAGDEISQMIKRADEALYRAKQSGRNCVYWHNGTRVQSINANSKAAVSNKLPGRPQPASESLSLTSLNGEVTRQICRSRRLNQPLSVVCVHVDTHKSTIEGTLAEVGSETVSAILSLAHKQLPTNSYSAPMGDSEFIVVLPGYRCDAAARWADKALALDAVREQCADGMEVRSEACELLALETAEQLLERAHEQLRAKTLVTL